MPVLWPCQYPLMIEYRYGFLGQFRLWNFLYADWYWLDVFELFICEFWLVHHYFLKYLGKEAKIRHWPLILHAILIEGGFFQKWGGEGRRGQTWSVKGKNLQWAIYLNWSLYLLKFSEATLVLFIKTVMFRPNRLAYELGYNMKPDVLHMYPTV